MNKKTLWQVGIVLVVIVIVLFGSTLLIRNHQKDLDNPVPAVPQNGQVTLSIEDIISERTVLITSDETPLEVLKTLNAQDSKLNLITKEYSGMGVLVIGLGEKKNGASGAYWHYSVNGTLPMIGADKLKLKNGDVILWYFDKS